MNLIMRVICATKGLAGLLLLQVGIGKLPVFPIMQADCIGIPGSDS